MSETGQSKHIDHNDHAAQEHEATNFRLRHAIENTGLVAATGAIGATANVVFRPVTVGLTPDVELKLSPAIGDGGTRINSGLLNIDLPNVKMPFVGEHVELATQISKFDIAATQGSEKLDRLVASFASFDQGIVTPVRDAVVDHLATGAAMGVGLTAGAIVANAGLRYIQQKRGNEHSEEAFLERRKNLKRSLIGVVAATIAFGAFNLVGPESKSAQAINTTQNIDPIIAQRAPDALKDAKIGGTFGDALHKGVVEVVSKLDTKENFWRKTVAEHSRKTIETFREQGGFDYQNNPDLVAIAHISDVHCDAPALQHMLGAPMEALRPSVIVNTGDTQTNMQTMPYEAKCFDDLIAATKKLSVPMIGVMGNHDVKRHIKAEGDDGAVIYDTLDKENNYQASIRDVTFVGAPDPRKSTWGETLPMTEEMTAQGDAIADTACAVQEKTGVPPMVLSHDAIAATETITRGCTAFAFSGHTHIESNIVASKGAEKQTQLAHTIGSLVGAGGGITQIEMPKKDASFGIHVYNKNTQEFVEHIAYRVLPDGTTSIAPIHVGRMRQ